jgi:hypothetical protein
VIVGQSSVDYTQIRVAISVIIDWRLSLMPFQVNGRTMYKTKEACQLAGTNVDTFFRWVREGKFADVEYRDRNGWRLFTCSDVRRLKAKAQRIYRVSDVKSG